METIVLQFAVDLLRESLAWPLRILSSERLSTTCLGLGIESADRATRRRLVIDVAAEHPSLHLAYLPKDFEPGSTGGPFGSLPGALVRSIEEVGDPRLFGFALETAEGERRRLLAAWTGRGGNLRLLDAEGIVIESLLRGGPTAGERYTPPPRSDHEVARPDPLELAIQVADQPAETWPKALTRMGPRIGVAAAADAIARALREDPAPEVAIPRALALLAARAPAAEPLLYLFPRRAEIAWPGRKFMTAEKLALPAAEIALFALPTFEAFVAARKDPELWSLFGRAHAALVQRARDAGERARRLREVEQEGRRLARLRTSLLAERGAEGEGLAHRRFGEAILQNFAQIARGQAELIAHDWSAEGAPPLRIPLDPAKSAKENAESYFRKARRWERGEPHRKKRLELIERAVVQLSYLETRIRDAESCPSPTAFESWRKEALGALYRRPAAPADAGSAGDGAARGARGSKGAAGGKGGGKAAGDARGGKRGDPRARQNFRPRAFTTKDGWTVWVGRSNQENDHVTHVLAHPEDLWFHAHGVPGSHVVLRREGRKDNPSAKTMEEAAAIAAFFSKARHAGKAPVIYTLKKYVRKPRKAPAGLAMVEREKMIMVQPRDPDEGRTPEWEED